MSRPSRCPHGARALLLALLLTQFTAPDAVAQFGKLKEKVKKTTEDVANTVDPSKAPTAPAPAPAPAASAEPAAAPAAAPAAGGAAAPAPAAKEWANYDFVPGNRVIFDIDFTDDKVGNFPQRLEFGTGQLEIVELDGVRMLKASDRSTFIVPLAEPLPERYTIEVDFLSKNGAWEALELSGGRAGYAGEGTKLDVGDQGVELYTDNKQVLNSWFSDADKKALPGTLVHLRVQGDGGYFKAYANEKRIVNVPNAKMKRENGLFFTLSGTDGGNKPVYIARIRVAESQQSIYDALAASGRWSTQGILFETGKSDLKPESTPTLKEIAGAFKGHADLKVEIQGHTDNVGKPADNLKLSEARAAAVKAALVGQYGVAESQLTTKGYGDTKPAGDNKTAEGRQNNRRVELVKQ
jgi:outer membrane protein OmpA-like peptidoglycan-associated protein